MQLLVCIVLSFLFGHYLSLDTVRVVYTASFILKEVLIAILPVIVFSYISYAIVSLDRSGDQSSSMLVILILVLVTLSNAITVLVAYGIAKISLPWVVFDKAASLQTIVPQIESLITLGIPKLASSDTAMMAGLAYGFLVKFLKNQRALSFSDGLQNLVKFFLQKCFIPLLPVYVTGFVLKMQYEGSLVILFGNFGQVFGIICCAIVIYIFVLFYIGSGFNLSTCINMIRRMLPAGLTGFSTISSAVAMPITMAATEENLGNTSFARLVVPLTVNFHMVGHSLSIPIVSLTLLQLFGYQIPTLGSFLIFTVYYCIAKFSASGIPGGGILVMIPALQSHLGFTTEMAGIIIMLDILQDPILTAGNVMGNGAFATIAYRVSTFCQKILKRKTALVSQI